MWKELLDFWKSDDLLQQAWNESFDMLKITQEMYIETVHVLRGDERELDKSVRKKDKIVNQYEQDVRKKVITHLAVKAPSGLPAGMVLVSIVIDIERIGDYAKNMYDLAQNHPNRIQGGKYEDDLVRIESAVMDDFEATRKYVQASDVDAAREHLGKYKWVNRQCDAILMDLVQCEDLEMKPCDAVAFALYVYWLKRIHSHLRNVVTSLVNPFEKIGFKPDLQKKDGQEKDQN